MISVSNLSHEFQNTLALNNVSFEIKDGAIVGLIGPNGSGKTTLLRCISTLQSIQTGQILINGTDIQESPREVHKIIGYLSDNFGLYDDLTVRKCLEYTAMSHIENVQNLEEIVKQTAIDAGVFEFIDKTVNTLSRGMRQRVGIAQAIIHNPKIVLLDEPASGLDPEARIALSQLIIQLKNKGMTLIVSSHILAELEDYCTEMIILKEGNLIEHTQLINHKTGGSTKNIIKLVAEYLSEEVVNSFISTFDNSIKILEKTTTEILFELNEEVTKQHVLLSFLIQQGVAVKEIAAVKRNLQDEYLKTMQEK